MKDIVVTVHINTFLADVLSQELRAPPREWSGWASGVVHPRRNVFIWTVPTISFTAAPPHELTLAHGRGEDYLQAGSRCGRRKGHV